ncbi:MAG: hypothetical protein JRN52_08665 [Nitrososphaerota archaeon]|nr:hypothetical protein [Nitrososphaerota archaeon]
MSDLMREENKSVLSARYQRIATLIIMIGVTMGAVDTTAVILGLPVMIRDLRSDIISLVWVLIL